MLNNWTKGNGVPKQGASSSTHPRHGKYSWLVYLFIALTITIVSQKLVAILGPIILLYLAGFSIMVILYAAISYRTLLVPFLVLIASVGVLRFVWSFRAPFLPDLMLDRISIIWLVLVFASYTIYNHTPFRKPFTIDLLLILHASYLGTRVLMTDPIHFHTWTISILTPYLIFFFSKNLVRTREHIHKLFLLLLFLSIYYTITSIAEKFHIRELLFPKLMIHPHPVLVGRSSGPFRSPGVFGDTMGMILPVFFYFIAHARNKFSKIALGVLVLLGFVAILFTYTRGSMLAAAIGMGVVVFLNRKTYLPYVLPVIVLLPLIAVMVVGVQDDEFLQDRLEATNPIEARVGAIVTAVRLWRDYPLFGCGPYQYKDYAEHYVAPVEAPLLGTVHIRYFRGSPAHDMYFGPLAEDGAVGLILQLLIYITIIRTSVLKLGLRQRNDHFATYVLPIFFGIYVIYFFGGFIISFRHFAILGSLFYMAAGVTDGYNPDESTESSVIEKSREG